MRHHTPAIQPLHFPPRVPGWVDELLACHGAGNFQIRCAHVPRIARADVADFQRRSEEAIVSLCREIHDSPARYPIRFWNFIPQIQQSCAGGLDRYMVFNAARFAAFRQMRGGVLRDDQQLPTATGVGSAGEDLYVYCLCATSPGEAVENPRQIPAYRYSRRYGPLPPCFARATRMEGPQGGHQLLVGGTASVRGERTLFEDNLAAQANETLANLSALVANASGAAMPVTVSQRAPWLRRFSSLRIYYVNETHRQWVQQMASQVFALAQQVELVQADLCRADLLIEIEGVATLDSPRIPSSSGADA